MFVARVARVLICPAHAVLRIVQVKDKTVQASGNPIPWKIGKTRIDRALLRLAYFCMGVYNTRAIKQGGPGWSIYTGWLEFE